jgi:hypothetical protein
VVRRLKAGEILRGMLTPRGDPREPEESIAFSASPPSFEYATVFNVFSGELSGYIFTDDFEIGFEPRDIEWLRRDFPHIFPATTPGTRRER